MMIKRQVSTPEGGGSGKPPEVPAEAAARTGLTDEDDPALVSRFLYGSSDDSRRRAHSAARMARLIDAAEVVGISDTLAATLTDLYR